MLSLFLVITIFIPNTLATAKLKPEYALYTLFLQNSSFAPTFFIGELKTVCFKGSS